MKLIWDNRRVSRWIGISLSAAIMVSCVMATQVFRLKETSTSVTANRTDSQQRDDIHTIGTISAPLGDTIQKDSRNDSKKLREVYARIVKDEKEKKQQNTVSAQESVTSSTTAADETAATTTTTTAAISTQISEETKATQTTQEEASVSNGRLPFHYDDVLSVAPNMNRLSDFVNGIHPISFSWDTLEYEKRGYVRITLSSPSGSVTLDVKPTEQADEVIEPYTIAGEVSGSINISTLEELDWYQRNKDGGACICSVTWLRKEFAVAPIRGIDVGTGLAELTGSYLCVNGGATTLYKASDVIKDETKLNKLLASENAYTFVGGRLYTINGYLEKYYGGDGSAYPFEDCDMVVQYGCNSITEHNDTTGTWLIEYAIQNDVVVGITFMNKSYYKTNVVQGGATSSSTGTKSVSSTSAASEEVEGISTVSTTATEASKQSVTESTASVESGKRAETAETTDQGSDVSDDTVSTLPVLFEMPTEDKEDTGMESR